MGEENSTNVYKDPLSDAHSQFNKNRKIIIKNVPPVTYEEVKQFIGQFTVSNISISKKSRHAVVTLVHGEEADQAVGVLSHQQLLGTDVQVSLCCFENMLCVTHIPLTLSDEEFRKELEPFGPLEKCFFMKNSQTGRSKGYGFVEFAHNRMKSEKACEMLNRHRIGSHMLRCAFMDPSILRFDDLHSKVLLVEDLPPDYSNVQELQNICSVIIEPTSLQLEIAQRLAVVEYADVDDADATQHAINGHAIAGCSITVSFCRPGEKVEDLCHDAVRTKIKEEELAKVPPLMPPDGRVVHPSLDPNKLASPMVKKLLAENPEALGKFVDLLGMLQAQIMTEQEKLQPGIMGPAPGTASAPLMNPNLQIALLSVMMAQQIQRCQPSFIQEPNTQDFILNSLQQRQPQQPPAGKQQPSLLGSPLVAQANSLLMNVMNNSDTQSLDNTNANPQGPGQQFSLFPGPEQDSLSTSCLQDFHHIVTALTPKSASTASSRLTRSNLTETNRGGVDSDNEVTNTQHQVNEHRSEDCTTQAVTSEDTTQACANPSSTNTNVGASRQVQNPFFHLPGVGLANPFLASFIEQQIKSQVQQINQPAQKPVSLLELPVMNRNSQGAPHVPPNRGPYIPNAQGKPGLLGEPPMMPPRSILGNYPSTPTSWNKPNSLMGNFVAEKRTLSFDDGKVPLKRKSSNHNQSLLGEPPASMARNFAAQPLYNGGGVQTQGEVTGRSGHVTSLMDMDFTAPQHKKSGPHAANQWGVSYGAQQQTARKQQNFNNRTLPNPTYNEKYLGQASAKKVQTVPDLYTGVNQQDRNPQFTTQVQGDHQSGAQFRSTIPNKGPLLITDNRSTGNTNPHTENVRPLMTGFGDTSLQRSQPLINHGHVSSKDSTVSGSGNIPSLLSQDAQKSGLLTQPHLVPSPEASPGGVYVGQHSQGLGGHYADSYLLS